MHPIYTTPENRGFQRVVGWKSTHISTFFVGDFGLQTFWHLTIKVFEKKNNITKKVKTASIMLFIYHNQDFSWKDAHFKECICIVHLNDIWVYKIFSLHLHVYTQFGSFSLSNTKHTWWEMELKCGCPFQNMGGFTNSRKNYHILNYYYYKGTDKSIVFNQ